LWQVLGPLQVRLNEGWTTVGAPKWRVLLATLLTEPDRVVATESLIDELWGNDPPPSARKLISGYVLRLRQLLRDPDGRVLVTQAPGYRLVVQRAELDSHCFEDLFVAGRRAFEQDDVATATDLLDQALALWRGPALADVSRGRLTGAEADRLAELWLAATELHIDIRISLGTTAPLVAELRGLTTRHPLRERLWHQLIQVLRDTARTSEALAAYADARRVIGEELGTEPGPDLRRLHEQLLGSTAVDRPNAITPAGTPAVLPRLLPPAVAHFVGRSGELTALSRLAARSGHHADAAVISAISGASGVGKTALALRWAHQVADQFPDGQLYVNLRGYDVDQPMPVAEALARLLRALGVPDATIPDDTDDRAALYRSVLADRRILIVLDNARDVAHVRPLLPGGPSCVTLVTSRDMLAGLVARDGAQRLALDPLPLPDAVDLLRELIGARAADPRAVTRLAMQCSCLPLALRVAAELAATRPGAALNTLTDELDGYRHRLELLDTDGDPYSAVRTVFSWSSRYLPPNTARTYALAAWHPGTDFDHHAVAALTDTAVAGARRSLDQLVRAHLIHTAGPDRYGMHDLLRAHARELADDAPTALTRLSDYYLHTARAATTTLYPAWCLPLPPTPAYSGPAPSIKDSSAAREWLNAERANLVAVVQLNRDRSPSRATTLAAALFSYLECSGHLIEASAIYLHALHSARRNGDHVAESSALTCLGAFDVQRGDYATATDRFGAAVALSQATGDLYSEARALGEQGVVDRRQGREAQAALCQERALALFRAVGDRAQQALALTRLAVVEAQQGHHEQAVDHGEQALTLFDDLGDQYGEAYALTRLGNVELQQGQHARAAHRHQQALDVFRQLTDPIGEAEARNGLGDVLLATGRITAAHDQYAVALELADQTGDLHQQALAHHGLAQVLQATGDHNRAHDHRQQAQARYTTLGAPEPVQLSP
jgi:DNA-binding SARP family transcriptional activator/tetratricopeptide (TPR) repeat protein